MKNSILNKKLDTLIPRPSEAEEVGECGPPAADIACLTMQSYHDIKLRLFYLFPRIHTYYSSHIPTPAQKMTNFKFESLKSHCNNYTFKTSPANRSLLRL